MPVLLNGKAAGQGIAGCAERNAAHVSVVSPHFALIHLRP